MPRPQVNALEDHSGVLWLTYRSGNGLASWDRRSRRLTRYSFKDREPPASQLSGVAGIHEDADGNLWLATYGSGLVRIDPNRRSAVQYRHSPLRPDGISDDMLGAVFEDREGNIWVGSGTGRLNHFRRKPLPFTRYRHEENNPQSLLIPAISSVYVDSQDNIWVGHVRGRDADRWYERELQLFPERGERSGEPLQHIRDRNRRGSLRLPVVRNIWGWIEPVRSADGQVHRIPS